MAIWLGPLKSAQNQGKDKMWKLKIGSLLYVDFITVPQTCQVCLQQMKCSIGLGYCSWQRLSNELDGKMNCSSIPGRGSFPGRKVATA